MTLRFRILAVAGLAFSLSGCALLGGGPAPLDTFELTTTATAAAGPQRGRTQILIAEPTALQSLDGQEIVIRTSPGSIEYLSGAQWSDRLPRVVQVRLAEAFQASGRLAGVGLPGQGLAIDYQIVTEVRTFGVRVDGGARADVGLFVKVLNDRNGSVRASRLFTAQAPVSGAGNVAYAAALDQAFSQAISELVPWALSAM
ncbi:MAG: ABC-type transport auxiliary lipoprotein family protein [Aliihoeflea sp.]